MKQKLAILGVALLLLAGMVVPLAVFAAPVTVTIHVTAQVVSITNDKDSWDLGTVTEGQILYFSTNNAQDDDWSTITNTSNVHVDVELRGTDIEPADPTYTWTLASENTTETYCLYANLAATPTVYDVEVKKAATYSKVAVDLGEGLTNKWSMKFTAPTAFNVLDDGLEKESVLTLVATKHT